MSDRIVTCNHWDSWAAYTAWGRTKRRPGTRRENLINAALGLAGEVGEIIDLADDDFASFDPDQKEKAIDEAGDICFYAAWWIDEAEGGVAPETCRMMDRVDAFGAPCDFGSLVPSLLEPAEAAKKWAFHGKELVADTASIFFGLASLVALADTPLREILRRNVMKLEARYSNGFVPGGGVREAG